MSIFCKKCGKKNRKDAKFCNKCGDTILSSTPAGPLKPGTVLQNRYKIVSLVKAGGMGAIYKALDSKLDRAWAVKELLPPYGTPEQQAEATKWFKREAKLLARLDHPNLPSVSDYFTSNGRYYLVMTFVEGGDLEAILDREGKKGLPVEKVLHWSREVLYVLDYLHNLNPPIVYRDIKPANIMLHNDGRVMLIDFGIARSIHSDQSKKTAIGTSGYAPPEQCRGKAEPRSDLYALGATMHHLLTGVEPIPFQFTPLSDINRSICLKVEDIVTRALKHKVGERFSSAADMISAFPDSRSKNKAERVTKEDGYDWYTKGIGAHNKGDYSEAIICYENCIKIIPKFEKAWNNKGLSLYRLGQNEDAIFCYDKALSFEPEYSDALSNKGQALHKLGKFQEEMECYEKAIKFDPYLSDGWNNKGYLLYKQEDYDEAMECYTKAIKCDSENAPAWNNMGLALFKLKNYSMAIVTFEKAIKINPQFPEAWVNKGITYNAKNMKQKALEDIGKGLNLKPELKFVWNIQGDIYYELKMYDKSLICYENAIKIDPLFAEGWKNKSFALDKLNDKDEANKCRDKAWDLNPSIDMSKVG